MDIRGFAGKLLTTYSYSSIPFTKDKIFDLCRIMKEEYPYDVIKQIKEDTVKILCHIKYAGPSLENVMETNDKLNWCCINTKVGFDLLTFDCDLDVAALTPGSTITLEKNGLKINFSVKESEDNVLTDIRAATEDYIFKSISFEILLLDIYGIVQKSHTNILFFISMSEICHFTPFFSVKELKNNCHLLNENNSTLRIDIKVLNGRCETPSINYTKGSPKKDEMVILCLKKDFGRMLIEERNADVQLKTRNRIFNVNKEVLNTRSPVFRAMFEVDMIERKTGKIDCLDMDSLTGYLLLEFIYTGEIFNLNVKSCLNLLLAAHKYQITSLVEVCANSLKFMINYENASDIISVAELIDHQSLKEKALTYQQEDPSVEMVSAD